MKKLVLSIVVLSGALILAAPNNDELADEYYASLDIDNAAVAAYHPKTKIEDDGGREVYRKRAHRRKRMIRPPSRGK